jgi:hypothetical protein
VKALYKAFIAKPICPLCNLDGGILKIREKSVDTAILVVLRL